MSARDTGKTPWHRKRKGESRPPEAPTPPPQVETPPQEPEPTNEEA